MPETTNPIIAYIHQALIGLGYKVRNIPENYLEIDTADWCGPEHQRCSYCHIMAMMSMGPSGIDIGLLEGGIYTGKVLAPADPEIIGKIQMIAILSHIRRRLGCHGFRNVQPGPQGHCPGKGDYNSVRLDTADASILVRVYSSGRVSLLVLCEKVSTMYEIDYQASDPKLIPKLVANINEALATCSTYENISRHS